MTRSIASLRHTLASRLGRPSLYAYLTLVLVGLGMLLGQRVSESSGITQLAAVAGERLELYTASLEAELARHSYLPSLMSIDQDVQGLLRNPQDLALRRRTELTLARITVRAGATSSIVTDADAQVLASSERDSLSAAEQARLRDAIRHSGAHFFATNERDGSTDFLMLHPVRRGGRVLGAVVVKLNLAPLEATWIDLGLRSLGERLLVVDENQVVIMSSVPEWKYRLLGSADTAQRKALQASARYPGAELQPMGLDVERLSRFESSLLPVPAARGLAQGALLLAQQRSAAPLGVRLVTLSDPSEVWRQARYATWGGGAAGAALGMLMLYLASRRRALQVVSQARNELQRAHAELERQVDARTIELRQANRELKLQIDQRVQAERQLVQAGKLAVLGQMSAGISHEVNQPLTALRALSGNTLRLLEAGRTEAVADNLRAIDAVAERMSVITRQLKNFSRKTESRPGPVRLAAAVGNVLVLLEHRLRAEQIEVHMAVPEDLRVRCDGNRLEQVLVNLVGNALDAMTGEPLRRLHIGVAEMPHGRVLVRVSDSGRGMDDDALARLFEPFFTTKPAGSGLGLGLVISSKIVHEFGGTLRGMPAGADEAGGGMVFEFDLESIDKEAHV